MAKYTPEKQIFLYNCYVKMTSYKLHKRRFCHKYDGVQLPASSTIFKLVKKVCSARPFLDKKYKILNETGIRLHFFRFKSLA
jgi:hypothetical protein